MVTREEEGLRKQASGEIVSEMKNMQRLSELCGVPNKTVILNNDKISLVKLGPKLTIICIWQQRHIFGTSFFFFREGLL